MQFIHMNVTQLGLTVKVNTMFFFFPPSYVHLKFIYVDGYLNLNNTTVDIANPQLHHKVAL